MVVCVPEGPAVIFARLVCMTKGTLDVLYIVP